MNSPNVGAHRHTEAQISGLPLLVVFEDEWPQRVCKICEVMARKFSSLEPFSDFTMDDLMAFVLHSALVKIGPHTSNILSKDFHPTLGAHYTDHLTIES